MTKLATRLATTVAALALITSPALAQTKPAADAAKPADSAKGQGMTKEQSASKADKDRLPHVVINRFILVAPGVDRVQPVKTDEVYKGWRANALIDQTVLGANGAQFGEVHDILVGPDGKITALIVEGGGFLEIGDTHLRVPLDKIDMTPGRDGIVMKVTEKEAERFGMFDGDETPFVGPREWRVSELIGDHVRLRDGVGYGIVSDVVFDKDNKVISVLANRDVRYGSGVYAYPYYGYGYGWDPGQGYYAIPHDSVERAAAAPRIESKRFTTGAL